MSRARDIADLSSVSARLDTVGGSEGALSNRNIIINGAMQIAQRGASATGKTSAGYYTVDRFQTDIGSAGTWTFAQSSTAPDGFANSLKVDCTATQTSLSGDKYFIVQQKIEGQNLQQLKFGTSNALPITLSFYVKSNKTGTYHLNFYNTDNARQNGKTYTIDAANTWEQKTISLDGDTAQGFTNDNNESFMLEWWLVAGTTYTSGSVPTAWQAHTNADRAAGQSVNLADSTSNEWLITGVQLEVGNTATPFEHRSFAEQLRLCQRYFSKSYAYATAIGASTGAGMRQTDYEENNQGAGYREKYDFQFPIEMRAAPSITIYDSSGNSGKCNYYMGSSSTPNKTLTLPPANTRQFGGYSDRATTIGGWATHYTADAEL
jgi:hypothetical protein